MRGRGPLGARRAAYGERSLVERVLNQLKCFRGIASRYDERGIVYLRMI